MKNIQEGVILPLIKYQDEVCVGGFSRSISPHIIRSELCNRGIPFIIFPTIHHNLRHFPMYSPHIQHPCRNPMVEAALDKFHSDEHSCIVFLVSFFVFLLKVTVPFIFSFLLLRYCASFSYITKTSPLRLAPVGFWFVGIAGSFPAGLPESLLDSMFLIPCI